MLIFYHQHSWHPPENLQTPMLILTGEKDAVTTVKSLEDSAKRYGVDFLPVEGAGHT